jgi:predicted nicotinamide N-methyase
MLSGTIGGYPAEWKRIELETPRPGREARALELWCVAEIETLVDATELLRADNPPDPPYWALPWIGARAIAALLLDSPPAARASVLEIGCGLGLAGVAAGLGGASVLFSDYVPAALEFASANAELNGLPSFETGLIDFTRDRLSRRFDLVVAADVVYEPASYEPLVAFLDEHVVAEGGRVLLTESLRADAKRVLAMLAERGFALDTATVWVPEAGKLERTWLHTLERKKP